MNKKKKTGKTGSLGSKPNAIKEKEIIYQESIKVEQSKKKKKTFLRCFFLRANFSAQNSINCVHLQLSATEVSCSGAFLRPRWPPAAPGSRSSADGGYCDGHSSAASWTVDAGDGGGDRWGCNWDAATVGSACNFGSDLRTS